MSTTHLGGNAINEITREEHDGTINAKRTSMVSAATIYAVVNTAAGAGGQATVSLIGNVTVEQGTDPWNAAIIGNVTIDSIAGSLPAGTNAIGKLAANSGVDIGDVDVTSNTAWADPNTFIGLATVEVANTVTVDLGANNDVTLTGNVTIDSGTITAVTDITNPVAIKGNITLSDPKTYIGLVTATHAPVSVATVITQIISATGNSTLFVAPASKFFVVKDLMVGSLGSAEIKFMEEGTDMIEYISLATQGGYSHHFGVEGLRAGTVQKSFVAALNGAATVSIMANVRFED